MNTQGRCGQQRFFSLSLLCLWPVLTGLAVSPLTEGARTAITQATAASVKDSGVREEWLGVYQDDKKVGYVQRRLTPTKAGYEWEEHWWLTPHLLNDTQTTHTAVRARADRACALTSFSLWSVGMGAALYMNADIIQRGASRREIRGESISSGEVMPFTVSLPLPLHLPPLCQMAAPISSRPGVSREFSVFNPLSLRAETVSLTTVGPDMIGVNGYPQVAIKLTSVINDTSFDAWVDVEGRTLKEEIAPGVILRQESRETATNGGGQEKGRFSPISAADFRGPFGEE